jgi:hypothetical protein
LVDVVDDDDEVKNGSSSCNTLHNTPHHKPHQQHLASSNPADYCTAMATPAIRKTVRLGDPLLRVAATRFSKNDNFGSGQPRDIVRDLWAALDHSEAGIGIAGMAFCATIATTDPDHHRDHVVLSVLLHA